MALLSQSGALEPVLGNPEETARALQAQLSARQVLADPQALEASTRACPYPVP